MYPDGWKIYAVHGVRVPGAIIDDPRTITVQSIEAQQNAEIRRVMLGLFGEVRYLQVSGANRVQGDECGDLYRKEVPSDEPLVMVRLVNSTPEPDGERKIYWLRVPPDVQTAREAVAWTFGIERPETYAPLIET